jgi:hypothetical protein
MPIAGYDLLNGAETCPPPLPATRCAVKACPFPNRDKSLCWQHLHFFDYRYSMTDTQLDPADLWDETNPWRPLLCVQTKADAFKLEPDVKVVYAGWRTNDVARTPQTGDGWRVAILAAQVHQGLNPLMMTVIGKDGIARQRPVNYAVGRGVGGKGHGRRRNLKCSQRAKAKLKLKNKVGTKHGAHDDVKRWTRETLEAHLPKETGETNVG